MSKIHHTRKRMSAALAERVFRSGHFAWPDGRPMTGVDIAQLACYRLTRA